MLVHLGLHVILLVLLSDLFLIDPLKIFVVISLLVYSRSSSLYLSWFTKDLVHLGPLLSFLVGSAQDCPSRCFAENLKKVVHSLSQPFITLSLSLSSNIFVKTNHVLLINLSYTTRTQLINTRSFHLFVRSTD